MDEDDESDEEDEDEIAVEIPPVSASAVAVLPKSSSVLESLEDEKHIQIAVIDSTTLKEERLVTLTRPEDESVSPRSYLASDGHQTCLYFITQRKPKKSSTVQMTADGGEHYKYVVDVYVPNAGATELLLQRSFELGVPRDAKGKKKAAEPSIQPVHWERTSVYATGYQICFLLPENATSTEFTKMRVFAATDGAFLGEVSVDPQTCGLALCYDATNNLIWSHNENGIDEWKNLGPVPKDPHEPYGGIHPRFSPESVLAQLPALAKTDGVQPLVAILTIIANMDRLARQHPIYGSRVFPPPEHISTLGPGTGEDHDPTGYVYCVGPDPQAFRLLHTIVLKALGGRFDHATQAYIVLACLRLLKVNIYELAYANKSVRRLGAEDALRDLRALLDTFVDKPPLEAVEPYAAQLIQREACSALSIGLVPFHSSPAEQKLRVVELLEAASSLSPGRKLLLDTLLTQLADWDDVAAVLLSEEPSKDAGEAMNVEQVEIADKMEVDKDVNSGKIARRLLLSLVEYVYEEGTAAVDSCASVGPSTSPLVSPALRLLLSLQRDLVSNPAYEHLLFDYASNVLYKAREFADHVVEAYPKLSAAALPALGHAMNSSLLRPVLVSLAAPLCRRKFVTDPTYAGGLSAVLTRLIKSVDALNKLFPATAEADMRYLRRSSAKKDKRVRVETKHPYAHGKQQLKQTVTIPGAEALCLHFDPRSRTVNPNADVLQLFKSAAMNEPLINAKDGKQMIYSSTNFPKQAITVRGDTVTFVFSASSRPDPRSTDDATSRWGFRCRVTPLTPTESYDPLFSSWLLDLENLLCSLAGKYAAGLIEGVAVSELERKYATWLDAKLLAGGLGDSDLQPAAKQFLDDFVENRGDAAMLYAWMCKQRPRRGFTAVARPHVEATERYVMAAVFKHLALIEDAQDFVQYLKADEMGSPSSMAADALNKEMFSLIVSEASKVSVSIQQRGQVDKMWRAAVKEKQTFEVFNSAWREEKKEKLLEMCEIKGVEFDMDEKTTIQRLFDKLQADIRALDENPAAVELNSYELMALPIVERAKLLLRMRSAKKEVESPSAETPNPFAIHRSSQSGEDNGSGSPASMLRSSSYYPRTETSISKESKRARLEQKNAAFSRRVQELRKWLSAFKGWRKWQEGALEAPVAMSDDPLHAVTSFVQSYVDPTQLENLLKVQTQRAKSRLEGLKQFSQLLGLVSFHSPRHQLLGSMGHPLSFPGGYYLDNVNACGAELSERLTDSYTQVFRQLIKILSDKNVDTVSRLMSLVVCGMSYRDYDVELLRSVKIFLVLQQAISECNTKIAAANRKAAFLSAHPMRKLSRTPVVIDTEKKEEERQYKQELQLRNQVEREDKEELDRVRALRNSLWNAFRLLTTRVVSWEREPGDGVADSEALRELHDQVFDLMCAELKGMSQRVRQRTDEDDDQCYELLSLLCLLGSSPTGHKALGRSENLLNLISIIKADSSEPRAKRLALRLLRRLLPGHNTDSIPKLIEFFLDQIGSTVYLEKAPRPASRPGTPDAALRDLSASGSPVIPKTLEVPAAVEATPSVPSAAAEKLAVPMEDEDEDDDHSADEEAEEEAATEEQFSIHLHSWVHGHPRLVEVCNAAMPNFFLPPGAMSIDRHSLDSRGQQILQAMAEDGSVLLKTTTQQNANLVATTIAAHGGSVTVTPVPAKPSSASADSADKNGTLRNTVKAQRKANPMPWLSGQVAQSLASEYLCLLRLLLDPAKGNQWATDINRALRTAVTSIPAVVSNAPLAEQGRRALGALCVLGGFTETVRVGGIVVELAEGGAAPRRGTVIELFNADECADVIFDVDPVKAPRTVRLSKLRPVPDVDIDARLFLLSDEVLAALLYFVSPDAKPCAAAGWLHAEFKWRSLEALAKLLQNPLSAQLFLQGPAPEAIPALLQVAMRGSPSARMSTLEAEELRLSRQIWDALSKPQSTDDSSVVKMSSIVPHLAFADQAELLPTGFGTDKLQGFIFRSVGDVRRKLEYVYDPNQQLSRRSYGLSRGVPLVVGEVAVLANVGVQANALPEFYFEVTIDRTDSNGSLISIGLIPEGARTWSNGSYKYQANAKKATFSGGQKRQHDYGVAFRAKSTVGCLWNREEKAIYFTKDGADLGAAFTGVALGKFYPAVGVSKGVHVSINFGQEPFKFVRKSMAETQEEKEKRRLELEAKRKADRQAEKERREREVAPLLNMGFSLKMALIAMRQTHFSGPEAASNWLVENMGSYPFDDEESDKEEEPKEEAKPKKEEEKKAAADEKKPIMTEEQYGTNASQGFLLADNLSYAEPDAGKKQKGVPEAPSEWEENIIPTIRSFMEKDGFSAFEVEEYLQQIRGALGQMDEAKARAIVTQILGGAGLPIQFPSVRQAAAADGKASSLKIEELSRGTWIAVSKSVPADAKGWVPQMDRTVGRTGIVKSVDHQNGLVLVQFYNADVAMLTEWWYPVRLLERPEHASGVPLEDLSDIDAAKRRVETTATQLQQIWARQLLLSLLQNSPLGFEDEQAPLAVKDILPLVALENPSSALFRIPPLILASSGLAVPVEEESPFFPDLVRNHLLALFASVKHSANLASYLTAEILELLKQQCVFVSEASVSVASAKPPEVGPLMIKNEAARSVAIVFERACTVQSSSQAFLHFYADEQCTQLLHTFTSDKNKFPVVLPTNQFWMKLVCQSPTNRANCKYRFWVVPIHPHFGLACWLTDVLLRHAAQFVPDVGAACATLFDAAVNLVYALTVPSVLKETALYLVGQLIHASRRVQLARPLPLMRLTKLKAEMNALQETERKREGALYSSYLQSLVELSVVANERFEARPDEMEVDAPKKEIATPAPTPATPAQILLKSSLGVPAAATPATPVSAPAPAAAPAPKKKHKSKQHGSSAAPAATSEPAAPVSAPAAPSQPEAVADEDALRIAMMLAQTVKDIADKVCEPEATEQQPPAADLPPPPPGTVMPPPAAPAPAEPAAAVKQPETAPAPAPAGVSSFEADMAAIHEALFDSEDMDDDMRAALALSLAASPMKSDGSSGSAAADSAPSASAEPAAADVQMAALADESAVEAAVDDEMSGIEAGAEFDDEHDDDDDADADGDGDDGEGDLDDGDYLDEMDEDMKAALALSMQESEAAAPASESASAPAEAKQEKSAEPVAAPSATVSAAAPSADKPAASVPAFGLPLPLFSAPPAPSGAPREPLAVPLAPPSSSLFSFGGAISSRSASPAQRAGSGRSSPALSRAPSGNGSQPQGSSADASKSKNSHDSARSWLDKVISVKQLLKALLNPGEHPELVEKFVKIAWPATRKETMKERIVLLDNLPMVDLNAKEELEALIKRTLRDIAPILELYMPIDQPTKQTKGYAFVQVASQQKVESIVKKLHRHHLKLPSLVDDGSNTNLKSSLRASASLPRGTIKVSKLGDLEAKDARVADYFQSKLVSRPPSPTAPTLTPATHAALSEVFALFGGDKDGALVAKQLNELQLASNGVPLSDEQIQFAFSKYSTKLVGDAKETGLSLDGFLDLYLRQSIEEPLDTWDELFRLGYDLALGRNSYFRLEDALRSQFQGWNVATMAQLVELAETHYVQLELASPLQLPLDQLSSPAAESTAAMAQPLLARQPTPAIRLRFELLRLLNEQLRDVLPFVNLARSHHDSLAYLATSARSLIFHNTKMDFVYEVLDKTSVQVPQPVASIDRLKLAAKSDKGPADSTEISDAFVLNHTLFGIAFQQLRHAPATAMRQKKPPGTEPHFGIKIVFKGENVQGEGGPYRQFFTDISRELQGKLPLFIMCPNAQHGTGENRDKWIINPSADSPLHIAMFEFFGRLMGLAIRTGVLLILDLPAFFWKPLVGLPNEARDLQQIDRSVYGALDYFSKCTREQFEQECPHDTFTTKLSDGSTVPLMSNGENIKITYDNRLDYIRLVEQVRLTESAVQVAAIRRGLGDIVPLPLLGLCTWQDVEWKICGKPYIDVNLLKRHTTCSGVASDAPHVVYFWNVMHELSQPDRRGFLRFAWAQERLPPNDEEFERTKTRMMIKPFPNLADPNSAFPKADTCFFNLMLPEYTSQKILRDRLLFAVATDSHSMNADEPHEDELTTVNGRRASSAFLHEYTDESDSE
eukprot:TRINITY_DN981_c0_g3_i2.p1 TRINITY_DN981_c0_g3~~TRINITY_DN981_c0_g3_i2.p1  ORF type:complete len:4579 (-),score=1632.50 TRINITY_DN981_c0_g3_i2:159-12473(-)